MEVIITSRKRGGRGEYVGRPSPLGNPYPMRNEGERIKVIRAFARWFQRAKEEDPAVRAELDRLYRVLKSGRLELTCWCSPRKCHAEIIARELAARAAREGLHVEVRYA